MHKPEIQHRLRQLWLEPEQLDPSKHAARVTRQVSAKLAALAKSLELNGYDVERVASFLKRCLFTMFAEDVELLPRSSFHDLLVDIKERNLEAFPHALKALWETMNTGGYSERLMQPIKRFNGGLFKNIDPIPLNVQQIQLLIDAAAADWRFVEPAIFGTLLERALDPRERHKLGAHYTPGAYVERLVMPTLIEPLREQWRDMSLRLTRYIATVETTKHRLFTFLSADILPDNMLVNIAVDNPAVLGMLSSRMHIHWALSVGGTLEDRPRYNKTRCFETFPFPVLNSEQAANIGTLAERIDAHRKKQQAVHASLTLTGMYNVLEKLRAGEELTAKEKIIHQQGLVSVLRELHDDLDHAVFEAYGWSDLADKLVGRPGATTPLPSKATEQAEAEEELLMRLVELNKQRAQEEAQGIVRWLRPEYQAPDAVQQEVDVAPKQAAAKQQTAASKGKAAFPKTIPEQLRVLREALAERAHTAESLAELFKRRPRKSVEEGLQSLAAVGVVEYEPDSGTWHVA